MLSRLIRVASPGSVLKRRALVLGSRWFSADSENEGSERPTFTVSNVPVGLDASSIYHEYFTGGYYKPREVERHVVSSVEVINDNVDLAFNTLRRRTREEGFEKVWRTRRHIRACLRRREARRDAEYRKFKRQVAERMKWIYRFKDRGF